MTEDDTECILVLLVPFREVLGIAGWSEVAYTVQFVDLRVVFYACDGDFFIVIRALGRRVRHLLLRLYDIDAWCHGECLRL